MRKKSKGRIGGKFVPLLTGDRPAITQLSARRIGYRVDHIRAWLDGKRRSVVQ